MALRRWLKIGSGTTAVPRPAALPVLPPLVVIAPDIRTAELWLREVGLRSSGRIRLVTPDRPDRLRGMHGPLEIIWVHGAWECVPANKFTQLHDYVGMLKAFGNIVERDVSV